jgi:hypothetical protein
MARGGLITADGLKDRLEEVQGNERPITADLLKIAKEGVYKLKETLEETDRTNLAYSDFAVIIRQVAEMSAKVGGLEVAARCVDVLSELSD